MADKTVLVTGACGEIGQALVQELSKRGGYQNRNGRYRAFARDDQKFSERSTYRGIWSIRSRLFTIMISIPSFTWPPRFRRKLK